MSSQSSTTSTTGPSTLRPTGFAETILIITILLGILCAVAVALRTWQRMRDQNFHIDDGITWLGLIFNLLQYAVVIWGTTVGIASPSSMLADAMQASAEQATYWLQVTYVLAMGFTKASVCSTLLRINKGTGHWKTTWTLLFIMATVAASTTALVLYYFIRCDASRGCRASNVAMVVVYFLWVGTYILVDIALSVVPLFIIRGLNMKKSLKLSLGVILAMGSVACLASILRIPGRLDFESHGDAMYKLGSIVLWGEVETGLSIVACCLPMMCKLLRSFDADHAAATPGRPAYYQPGSSDHSGQAPSNDIQRLPNALQHLPSHGARHFTMTQLDEGRCSTPTPAGSQRQHLCDPERGWTCPARLALAKQ